MHVARKVYTKKVVGNNTFYWIIFSQADSAELLEGLETLVMSGQFEVTVDGTTYTATSLHYTSTDNPVCPQGWMPHNNRCCKLKVFYQSLNKRTKLDSVLHSGTITKSYAPITKVLQPYIIYHLQLCTCIL